MHRFARLRPLCTLIALTSGFASEPVVAQSTHIDLAIDEAVKNRSVPWPVTTGVPFAAGTLTQAEQCRLVDDRGVEQPLQSKVAATWDEKKSTIRWLTIDFIAEPGRRYALEFGPEVRRRDFPKALDVRDGESLVIETGRLRAEFSRKGPAALRAVSIDLNGDGRIAADEQVAGGASDGDHVWIGGNGAASTSARDGDERKIVVESDGPVRSCVRVDGWYTGPDGRRIVRYRTRYHFFAGLSLLKASDEFRVVGSTRDVTFRDVALPLDIKLETASRNVTAAWDDASGDTVSVPWQAETKSVSLAQEVYRHYGNLECRAVVAEKTGSEERMRREGERAGAWIQAGDRRAAITGALRWFWQQFPKEWEVAGDRLILHTWSPRGGPLNFGESGLRKFFGPAGHKYLLAWDGVRGAQSPIEKFFYFAGRNALERDGADGLGMNKHHEVWFHFAPAAEAAAGREYGALAGRPPLCLATGEWNVSTGVFGPLAARPNDSPYEAIVDRLFELERYAQDTFGDYGWWLFGAGPHYSYQWDKETQRHYADPRRFEYHTYQRETQLWWCYLRSGERKFYDWAIPAENHWVDVAVSHVPTKFSSQWRGGMPAEATLHYAAGDWSIDSPLHYVRHHDTGEAWLRSAPQFWASYHRTLETTTLAYYLTGDERFNDVVEFWRAYWGALAGVRSDSIDIPPWHREQLWFQPTKPGEPTKTWAEMLRDYAPFQSGSRHQLTLFFNLATLYEHTWDPMIGKALREFADAYLDPESPNGVWQCQDHRLPANANSPMLSHYWSSALWKYARASNDPRMPGVLRKYFTACYEADPYGEEVGIYSNVQIAWAWHFTHDPRHLIAAQHELDSLFPAAAPLKAPEDLGPRIYNPYDPIRCLAAAPRLIGALAEAKRRGIPVPAAPPLTPQRALIALHRPPGEPLRAVTWGWDKNAARFDADGEPFGSVTEALTHRSHRQPFDRSLPGFEVFRTTIEAGKADKPDWCFLSPALETGLLEGTGFDAVWCWAGEPVLLEPGRTFWRPRGKSSEFAIETSEPAQVQVLRNDVALAGKLGNSGIVYPLADVSEDEWLAIRSKSIAGVWIRISGVPDPERWVSTTLKPPGGVPPSDLLARRARPVVEAGQMFVPGRFGQGMLLVPGREFHIPDEIAGADGTLRRLSDQRQGTIEFWIRRLSDDRLTQSRPWSILENGSLQALSPAKLPLDEWAHVAVVWRPRSDDPERTLTHIYVDGRDHATYRNLHWEGYAPPPTAVTNGDWKKEFVFRAPPGMRYIIDDLRISKEPRYADLSLEFGSRQTWNPLMFKPPTEPSTLDGATVIHLPLDGSAKGTAAGQRHIEGKIVAEPR